MILAAGKGKRMGADVPKALVEIAGRPMVEHLVESIHESEVDGQPILIVAPDTLEDFNNVCRDRRCEFAIQDEQLGTGHAVQSAREKANGAEAIMVLYGDHPFLSPELIASLSTLHEESGGIMTMITTKVKNFDKQFAGFKSWGRIVRDVVGNLVAIREAKDCTEEELLIKELNPALMMFDAQWLWDHLPEIKNKNASGEYYLTDLVEMAIEEGETIATESADPFEVVGINTPEDLARAEKVLG